MLFFLPKHVSAIEYTCCSITNSYESDSANLREKSQRNPTFENVYQYLTSIYHTEFGSSYLQKINKAIVLFPDSGHFHYLKGMTYTDQPLYNKKLISEYSISSEHFNDSLGIISFLRSAELSYMVGDCQFKVGSIFYHQHDFLKAKLYLNKAIKNGVCCHNYSPSVLLTIVELKTLQIDSAINTYRKARATYSTKFDDELSLYLSADSALQEKILDVKWTFQQKEALDDMYSRSLYDFRSIELQSLRILCDILDSTIVDQSETTIDTIYFNGKIRGDISPSKIDNPIWKYLNRIVPNKQEGEVEVLEQNFYIQKEDLKGMSCNKAFETDEKRALDNTLVMYRRVMFGEYYYVYASFRYAGFHTIDLLFKFDEHGKFLDYAASTSVE